MPTAAPALSLLDLGWDQDWALALASAAAGGLDPDLVAGRVSRIDRGMSTVLTTAGPVRVAAVADLKLAVGDWVALASEPAAGGAGAPPEELESGHRTLAAILPRRCAFRRITDNAGAHEQVVAANIDTVWLVDAVDGQLSARHLERYIALAWQSGATPVVVVTKSDLATPEELERRVAAVREAAAGVAVHVVSVATGAGLDALAPYLAPGRTVALLGLSGAGKSTLVNLLAEARILATGAVRSDGKGRHTTTYRELVVLPGGGMVIDTPGMRALSVATATDGIAQVFSDIELWAEACRFPYCSHTSEEGCAVTAAVAAGALSEPRLASWRQLALETPVETPQAGRTRITERKRQKATAKVTRSESRARERHRAPPPPSPPS